MCSHRILTLALAMFGLAACQDEVTQRETNQRNRSKQFEDARVGDADSAISDVPLGVDAGEVSVSLDASSPLDASEPDASNVDSLDAGSSSHHDAATAEEDAGILVDSGALIDASSALRDASSSGSNLPKFAFPVASGSRGLLNSSPIFGVDHDPIAYTGASRIICRNHANQSFPWCYDEHRGSDYALTDGFTAMDNGSAPVVAAAGGVVEAIEDGNYDRCRASLASLDVTCDGYPMRPNYVAIRHRNGWLTYYLHLKQSSVQVAVGDRVSCGDTLGLIGSSGYSTAPHIHFEVQDATGTVWDPYAGVNSQQESLWVAEDAGDGLPSSNCDPNWASP